MKTRMLHFGALLRALIVLALFGFGLTADAAEGKAEVRSVIGGAEYAKKGAEWKPLKEGSVLNSGARVKTGVNSQVSLSLGENGPSLTLASDTVLELGELKIDHTSSDVTIRTRLSLLSGAIFGTVKKLAAASQYEVKTPYTLCVVRSNDKGVGYQITADGVHLVTGDSILVTYINPRTLVGTSHPVNDGHTFLTPVDGNSRSSPMIRPTQPSDLIAVLPASEKPATKP